MCSKEEEKVEESKHEKCFTVENLCVKKEDVCEEEKQQEEPCEETQTKGKEMKKYEDPNVNLDLCHQLLVKKKDTSEEKKPQIKLDLHEGVKKRDGSKTKPTQKCEKKQFERFNVAVDPCEKAKEISRKEQEKKKLKAQEKSEKKKDACSDKLTEKGKELCRIYNSFLQKKKKQDEDKH